VSATEDLKRAYAVTGEIVDAVKEDDLDEPTPCACWRVRDLINHLLEATEGFAIIAETGSFPQPPEDNDYTSGDFKATYAEQSARCMAAFSADGVMERMLSLPFGEIPGAAVIGMATTDAFVHGWDLARALGRPTDFDPDLAARMLERARKTILPEFRGPEGAAMFGPEVEVAESAPMADRLAGFLGRQV
jgi:uncharacterized protein (TIGR03086 family)